jgi:hypothetical protein
MRGPEPRQRAWGALVAVGVVALVAGAGGGWLVAAQVVGGEARAGRVDYAGSQLTRVDKRVRLSWTLVNYSRDEAAVDRIELNGVAIPSAFDGVPARGMQSYSLPMNCARKAPPTLRVTGTSKDGTPYDFSDVVDTGLWSLFCRQTAP